jgi:ribosomal protein S18 acetylase RimI-like enzyme
MVFGKLDRVIVPPIALRPLRTSAADDELQLYELHAVVRADELRIEGLDPALRAQILRQQFEAQRRSYRDRFPNADERLILRGETPIGWVIVDRSGPELRVIDIALLPDARRQGIGTLIIRDLQKQAAMDDRPMRFEVLCGNVRARALYDRLGFRAIGESATHTELEWRANPLPTDPAVFEQQLNTPLRIDLADGHVPLRIAEVVHGQLRGDAQRFSVVMHGPATPLLPQDSYLLHHEALGSFVLFIVPIVGSNAERIVYEACFTRSAPAAVDR